MLHAKKKLTKREIKQDRLVTAYFNFRTWLENQKKHLGSALLILFILAFAGYSYYNNQSQSREQATMMLGKVTPYFINSDYDKAIDGVPQEGIAGLQQIVDEYGSTPSGEIAKIYLAQCLYSKKEFTRALELFSDASVNAPILKATAYAGTAACYEAIENFEEAADYYNEAYSADQQGIHAAEYLYAAANNYILVGEKEKADELLTIIEKKHSASPVARTLDRLRALAKS